MRYCRKCGEEMESDVWVCSRCGWEPKKQNSKAEGALYGADAAAGDKRKKKVSKKGKKLRLTVGVVAGVVLIACIAILLFTLMPQKQAAQLPVQEPEVEEPAETTVSGECGEGVLWQLDLETGLLTISGTGAVTEAPWQEHQETIKEVVIENGVQSVVTMAFSGCDTLQTVTLPNTVIAIEDYAFEGCTSLSDATYQGAEEQWAAVTVGSGNDRLTQIIECICPHLDTKVYYYEYYESHDGLYTHIEKTECAECGCLLKEDAQACEYEGEDKKCKLCGAQLSDDSAQQEKPVNTQPVQQEKPVNTQPVQQTEPSTGSDPEDPSMAFRRIYAVHYGSYIVGEKLNRSNLSVRAVYGTGWEKEVSDFTVAEQTFTKAGEYKITVSWGGKSCTVEVRVREKPKEEKEVSYITATTSGRYEVNENVMNRLTVKAHYADGSEEKVYSYSVSTERFTSSGTYSLTITYRGKSCTINVTVR